jgi:hypothetical protein
MDDKSELFADIANYAGWLRSSNLARHLAITELFKSTINLPGSVAEFGVWRGSTFFLLARLIDIFDISVHERLGLTSRKLYGFDTFDGFQALSDKDLGGANHNEKMVGGLRFDMDIFNRSFEHLIKDIRQPERVNIIKGDVIETFQPFLETNGGVRFNFVNLDMDLYEPTKFVLDRLPEKMVRDGVILFDEYGYEEWPGATEAVDEFIGRHKLMLRRHSWSYGPGAYCRWLP